MTASSAGTARSRTRPRGAAGKSGTAGQLIQFARGFIKHPKMVGSIIPSSRQCIARMLKPVDWAATQVFVEYGPGVGTFTRPVLDQLSPDAKLIAIDTNPDFVAYLRSEIADPRLHCVVGSAADVRTILITSSRACRSRRCRPASGRRSPSRRPPRCGRAAPFWSTNSRPRCMTSLRRISVGSIAVSSRSTFRPHSFSGPTATPTERFRGTPLGG
jgi:hypothetical protein